MAKWEPYDPPHVWSVAGPVGDVQLEVELFQPSEAKTQAPQGAKLAEAGERRFGRAAAVFHNAAYLFMVEVWTQSAGAEARLEAEAAAQAQRIVSTREWERQPGRVYTFWLDR